ncbi:hypothetical protein C8J56DRAFT_1168397 [Mycena floridula]|nr:hypothetical protein C8J56DRAFT_1168397 [Mycena floridula]
MFREDEEHQTTERKEGEPGSPGAWQGPGLGLLRVKVHLDFAGEFISAILDSALDVELVKQLEIDIWGPPVPQLSANVPGAILAPRFFEDLPNLSHLSLVTNYAFDLSGLKNIETLVLSAPSERVDQLVSTLRDVPSLPSLQQYLIKVLIDPTTTQRPDDWISLDNRIWSDTDNHASPCGRGLVFRHIIPGAALERAIRNSWRRFFYERALYCSSQIGKIMGYPM